jgi:hypothetical protein
VTEEGSALAPSGMLTSGTFRIDRDGAWHHEGVEVTHPGVLRNLFANLRVEGDAHYLAIGPARVPVAVEDTPFVVVRVEVEAGTGRADIRLTDGSTEPLAVDTLVLDARGVPYCRVKEGRFRARLSVPAWLQLIEGAEVDPATGAPVVVLGDRRIHVERRPS